ncbi:MAG: hypothetical protein WC342_04220 [Methanoregula sp.]|jgi:hypothetical protein
MQKTSGRKYQVVEEAEIDLVLQCRDSHEFYERYLKVFPDTKKGLDSISKIWKRRSEFAKKRKLTLPGAENSGNATVEIAELMTEQTKKLGEIEKLAKENLEVNRQILAALTHQNEMLAEGQGHHPAREPAKENSGNSSQAVPADHPVQKKVPEKQAPIMVGS